MKTKLLILSLALCTVMAAVLTSSPPEAQALSGTLRGLDSFSVTCGTTATLIQGDDTAGNTLSRGGSYLSIYCENITTTPVAWGDATLTTTTDPTICNAATCIKPTFSLDASRLYCRAGSDTVIKCVSGS